MSNETASPKEIAAYLHTSEAGAPPMRGDLVIDPRLISVADQLAALDRMTETETADTLAEIHQSYTTELQGTQA